VHKVKVFFDNQSGTYRVHEFHQSGKEEHNTEQESAEALES
jgi:hypothetical protein